ncbi:MarR family transcriptional regulator [Paenibacillus sp. FSL W8-0187]|jgi:MarR family transcriptional regulator, 2-MHQ and catechol-resistance regulon repressor|uniref:MarR family transcriptional regulator n=2 Tax=Bacillota TaxID=1239 RepID=A0A1R1AT63_PAELA|nr:MULTISPECIES: MarR family transcriptional regulator [Paenibacillus]OME88698.1 MarR family transcriptional regulator [Paenibacillus lautus]GIP01182.1 putative HTH-type transcriptional regulator YkoM [Paenibacillus lautus]
MKVSHERDTQLAMHLYRVFAKSFKSVNEHVVNGSKIEGFNPTSFAVMEVLFYKGRQPIQQIGAQLLLQSGNVTYVVDKLVEKGYVRRKPCPEDRRVIYAELTPPGEQLMQKLYPLHERHIQHALGGLDEEEKYQLIGLLSKMGKHAEQVQIVRQQG